MSTDENHWGLRALCKTEGHPSDWDDDLDGVYESKAARNERHRRAMNVCNQHCPVQLQCAQNTDAWRESGIWFGVHLETWREAQRQVAQARLESA